MFYRLRSSVSPLFPRYSKSIITKQLILFKVAYHCGFWTINEKFEDVEEERRYGVANLVWVSIYAPRLKEAKLPRQTAKDQFASLGGLIITALLMAEG